MWKLSALEPFPLALFVTASQSLSQLSSLPQSAPCMRRGSLLVTTKREIRISMVSGNPKGKLISEGLLGVIIWKFF